MGNGPTVLQPGAGSSPKSALDQLIDYINSLDIPVETKAAAIALTSQIQQESQEELISELRRLHTSKDEVIQNLQEKNSRLREELAACQVVIHKVGSWAESKVQEALEAAKKSDAESKLDPTGVTSLPNRKAVEKHLLETIRGRRGKWLSIMYFDIHGFKWYNDATELKHKLGDVVLRAVAEILSYQIRAAYLSRLGGDEFAAVLELDPVETAKVAIRFEDVVDKYESWEGWNPVLSVNPPKVDIGVVSFELGEHADRELYGYNRLIEDLFHLADTLMYQAKEDRRNKHTQVYAKTVAIRDGKLAEIR